MSGGPQAGGGHGGAQLLAFIPAGPIGGPIIGGPIGGPMGGPIGDMGGACQQLATLARSKIHKETIPKDRVSLRNLFIVSLEPPGADCDGMIS